MGDETVIPWKFIVREIPGMNYKMRAMTQYEMRAVLWFRVGNNETLLMLMLRFL